VRRILAGAILALLLLGGARGASAQVFGQVGPAEVLPVNARLFGGYLNASDDLLGLFAQLRLSFYPGIDFGFQGGVTRVDMGDDNSASVIRVGGDLKVQLMRAGENVPFDLSLGGALGIQTGDDISVFALGPTAVASRTFSMGSSGAIVPYAGIGLLVQQTELGSDDDSGVTVPLRLGSEFRFSPEFRMVLEFDFQLNDDFHDDIGLVTGVNLPF
jgi:hypothetical protein